MTKREEEDAPETTHLNDPPVGGSSPVGEGIEGSHSMISQPSRAVSSSSGRRISRRVVLGEHCDPSKIRPLGTRHSALTEYVAVPRQVDVEERVMGIPCKRIIEEIEPEWREQTVVRQIPKEKIVYHDKVTPVSHKRVIDEYIEEPFDDGTITTYKPKIHVQERDIEVPVPRIVWRERVEEIPEIREIVRYADADDNVERVIRYTSETPVNLSPKGFDTAEPQHSDSIGDMMVRPGFGPLDADTIVNVPVPFMVPKPICVPVEVPIVKFSDHFVPVPIRRHVKPKLVFTNEVYDVPCLKEKPVLIVSDEMKPVPVDIRIKVKEKDVHVNCINPQELSQADHHAMWMRVGADQLDAFKAAHGGLYPRGMHVPENMKVPLKPTDWEACMDCDEPLDQSDGELGEDDLGPLPFNLQHPLMLTYLQNKWMQTPTNLTHGLYTKEFVDAHSVALNNILHPECTGIGLTEKQKELIGPQPANSFPYAWSRSTYHSTRTAATRQAERAVAESKRDPLHQVTESVMEA